MPLCTSDKRKCQPPCTTFVKKNGGMWPPVVSAFSWSCLRSVVVCRFVLGRLRGVRQRLFPAIGIAGDDFRQQLLDGGALRVEPQHPDNRALGVVRQFHV